MNKILDVSMGDLARDIPGAIELFREYRLDFFCEGESKLTVAINKQGLNEKGIEKQLNHLKSLKPKNNLWAQYSERDIIEHIIFCYHEQYRQQVPQLIALAQRIELEHGDHPECPLGLTFLLSELEPVLNAHTRKEKDQLFPIFSKKNKQNINILINSMVTEHRKIGETLFQLNQLTSNITPPTNASSTWRALYVCLNKFYNELTEQIHLENNILFHRINAN